MNGRALIKAHNVLAAMTEFYAEAIGVLANELESTQKAAQVDQAARGTIETQNNVIARLGAEIKELRTRLEQQTDKRPRKPRDEPDGMAT